MFTILTPFRRPGILYSVMGLLHQKFRKFNVIIRDSGDPSPFDQHNQLMIDALVASGIKVEVIRSLDNSGVYIARADLYEHIRDRIDVQRIVWLDSDMLLPDSSLYELNEFYGSISDLDFRKSRMVVGGKMEVYSSRTYDNDIHALGSQYQVGDIGALKDTPAFDTPFCDMSLCCQHSALLHSIDWSLVRNFASPDLAGEDVIISALLRKEMRLSTISDSFLAIPSWYGFHMAAPSFRWKWEPSTDRMVKMALLNAGVDDSIINTTLPHIVATE